MQLTTVFEPPRPPAWTRFDGGVLVKTRPEGRVDASTAAEKRGIDVFYDIHVFIIYDNFLIYEQINLLSLQ
jgi:hypothetical protein